MSTFLVQVLQVKLSHLKSLYMGTQPYVIKLYAHGSVHRNSMLIKVKPDATVCRYLFIAKSLYMFRVSQYPSSGVLKTVTAASGTGHNTGKATSLQRGPVGPRWREVAVPVL